MLLRDLKKHYKRLRKKLIFDSMCHLAFTIHFTLSSRQSPTSATPMFFCAHLSYNGCIEVIV